MCPLPAGPGGPYLVQGQAAGYHDERAALVVYLAGIGAQQARERVLHDVFGGAEVTDHSEYQVNQVRAVLSVSPADRFVVLFPWHTVSSCRSAGRYLRAARCHIGGRGRARESDAGAMSLSALPWRPCL